MKKNGGWGFMVQSDAKLTQKIWSLVNCKFAMSSLF